MIKLLRIFKPALIKLLILSPLFIYSKSGLAQNKKQETTKNFYVGIDNSGDKCTPGDFFNPVAMDSLGVDFVVWHYRGPKGTAEDEAKKWKSLGPIFKRLN